MIYKNFCDAKIANPECAIFEYLDKFGTDKDILDAFDIHSFAMKECNPADYCMTVERFLAAGHKFIDGDIVINALGCVYRIPFRDCGSWNEKSIMDYERYILRAAALEKTNPDIHHESEYYKKPRTRVEYVKCDFSQAWEAVKEFECGQVFYRDANSMIPTDEVNYVAIELVVDVLVFHNAGNLYRKVETEIDERKEFIEAAREMFVGSWTSEGIRKMFDSGKFKYIGGDGADK